MRHPIGYVSSRHVIPQLKYEETLLLVPVGFNKITGGLMQADAIERLQEASRDVRQML